MEIHLLDTNDNSPAFLPSKHFYKLPLHSVFLFGEKSKSVFHSVFKVHNFHVGARPPVLGQILVRVSKSLKLSGLKDVPPKFSTAF